MVKRRRILFAIACVLSVVILAVVAWFATMPYPSWVCREAKSRTQYSNEWPISRADFLAAESLVREEMKFREIIWRVTVKGKNEIEFETLSRYKGPLAADGQSFIVRKVNGKWTVVKRWWWFS